MKKINTFLTMALTAITVMTTMTSCNPDEVRAWELSGTWTGYVETYYRDRYGITGDNYRTTMYFDRRDSYGGTGYEVSYNIDSRYTDYDYNEFSWEVRYETIYIYYTDGWRTIIRDYRLNSSTFEGYMDDGTNRDIFFSFQWDGYFDWSGWNRFTRSNGGEGHHASGEFAKKVNVSEEK